MKDFIAIDFETANPQRVSACSLGYVKVANGEIVDSYGYLIKPIGGHAPFQTKIHGIKEEHTANKPHFCDIYPEIKDIFDYPLVAHSQFDKQVLNALSDHFDLGLKFNYTDSSAVAKQKLPNLKDVKLKTLVKHFGLPSFKHHDAKEDAISCAKVFLKLHEQQVETISQKSDSDSSELMGMLKGIMADEEINYKEAYQLLYWMEDHPNSINAHKDMYCALLSALNDSNLDSIEAAKIKQLVEKELK